MPTSRICMSTSSVTLSIMAITSNQPPALKSRRQAQRQRQIHQKSSKFNAITPILVSPPHTVSPGIIITVIVERKRQRASGNVTSAREMVIALRTRNRTMTPLHYPSTTITPPPRRGAKVLVGEIMKIRYSQFVLWNRNRSRRRRVDGQRGMEEEGG